MQLLPVRHLIIVSLFLLAGGSLLAQTTSTLSGSVFDATTASGRPVRTRTKVLFTQPVSGPLQLSKTCAVTVVPFEVGS